MDLFGPSDQSFANLTLPQISAGAAGSGQQSSAKVQEIHDHLKNKGFVQDGKRVAATTKWKKTSKDGSAHHTVTVDNKGGWEHTAQASSKGNGVTSIALSTIAASVGITIKNLDRRIQEVEAATHEHKAGEFASKWHMHMHGAIGSLAADAQANGYTKHATALKGIQKDLAKGGNFKLSHEDALDSLADDALEKHRKTIPRNFAHLRISRQAAGLANASYEHNRGNVSSVLQKYIAAAAAKRRQDKNHNHPADMVDDYDAGLPQDPKPLGKRKVGKPGAPLTPTVTAKGLPLVPSAPKKAPKLKKTGPGFGKLGSPIVAGGPGSGRTANPFAVRDAAIKNGFKKTANTPSQHVYTHPVKGMVTHDEDGWHHYSNKVGLIKESKDGETLDDHLKNFKEMSGPSVPASKYFKTASTKEIDSVDLDKSLSTASKPGRVAISDLKIDKDNQSSLNKTRLDQYVSGKAPKGQELDASKPTIIKSGNTHLIQNGHHRLAAASIKGETHADVNIIDVTPKKSISN